ncbi:helix-turn-helix domain-containing protein [Dactylosporangium sp. NPDC051541]|uniref:helix-turn-helix domain-containing protein n=1 Tax=Dactylosporangium sp. NPDC051541 TaxID=3363977 RepID=UPI00379BABE6
MSPLTPESMFDPARARTRAELGAALNALRDTRGLSLTEIERRTRDRPLPLKKTTMSAALNGRTLISARILLALLVVCDVPEPSHRPWLDARQRIGAAERRIAARRSTLDRFDAALPRALGIHSAIVDRAADDLPTYVERDFDFLLRAALATDSTNRGRFVVLVGGSSTGKTRSLYEAVLEVAPNWWLVLPGKTEELLQFRHEPPSRTVFWLDELQLYLGSRPHLSTDCIRGLLSKPNIVVGTLWPDQYDARSTLGVRDTDEAADVRRLLQIATIIDVPDAFTQAELHDADHKATRDNRIRIALDTTDAGVTQVLAGGPALVRAWVNAPNVYAKAMITVAADAHRLGVQSPLNEDTLAAAMFGYLPGQYRVAAQDVWLGQARPHATRPLRGDVAPLRRMDDGRPGTFAGYIVADYLAQHLGRHRRTERVPHEAWHALVTQLKRPADLRRLADSATARLRFVYAETALERLANDFYDGAAATELAQLLIRQDRFESGIRILRWRLQTDPRDRTAGWHLIRAQELWDQVERLRPAAAADPAVRQRLDDILADGGVLDGLRQRAATGDMPAGEDLVDRLVHLGRLRELEERANHGQTYAAEALADLYLARGDLDRLEARVRAGDQAANLRLSKAHAGDVHPVGDASQLAALRTAAGTDPEAARQLCALLFALRDVAGLQAELEAGTLGAADRLLALYTADELKTPAQVAYLRAFGLSADGTPLPPPIRKDH